MILGLTGNIAAGKSRVSYWLRTQGWHIVDADRVALTLYSKNPALVRGLCLEFGEQVAPKGIVDRRVLGGIVFSNPEALARLNQMIRPWLRDAILTDLRSALAIHAKVVLDAPLLFEGGWEKLCTRIWCVYALDAVRLQRVMERGFTAQEAQARLDSQISQELKVQKSHQILDNSGPWEQTESLLTSALQQLEARL
jgi:dephospho-CoA kinase